MLSIMEPRLPENDDRYLGRPGVLGFLTDVWRVMTRRPPANRAFGWLPEDARRKMLERADAARKAEDDA
jgi:hypothetical protein